MASAQVLRKQEHLEAGKKKLEEFRRKKAVEKAKKNSSSVSQPHVAGGVQHEKQPLDPGSIRLKDSDGVGTSNAHAQGLLESRSNLEIANKESDISTKSYSNAFNGSNDKPSFSTANSSSNLSFLERSYSSNEESKDEDASTGLDGFKSVKDEFMSRKDDDGLSRTEGARDNFLWPHQASFIPENHVPSHSRHHRAENNLSKNTDGTQKNMIDTFAVPPSDGFHKNSFSTLLPNNFNDSRHEDNNLMSSPYPESLHSTSDVIQSSSGLEQKSSSFSDIGEKQSSGTSDHMGITNLSSPWISDHRYASFNSDGGSSSTHAPTSSPAYGRRYRPSFLDSIQISKNSSSSPSPFGAEKADGSGLQVYPMNGSGPSVSQSLANSSIAYGHGADLFNHAIRNEDNLLAQRQNDDFAALEQHIEDLTQEKFSLQRALEASRALAESLASENSTLTESFNQQGSIVNQLKLDLENLQAEIKNHMVELEAIREAYANAQLECSAADERAKLLASEVIVLEDKALRLRSNELKLERQLENTQHEISSYRKKMSSLEKDRQDLMSTINALQEEKKLLQTKIRKASSRGTSVGFGNTSITKKDVATSTENLDVNNSANMDSRNTGTSATAVDGDDGPSFQFSPENTDLSADGLPVDHRRMISNINTLIAELALEKDHLMQTLSAESSQSSKLLELNKELTRKLEVQTQRLELLTAQSLASDNIQQKQLDHRTAYENPTYADEGDEVVERVLGWIMKLFPGGPSRRRPNKHL